MSDESQSNNHVLPGSMSFQPKTLTPGKTFSKIINVGLLAVLGGSAPALTFAASQSTSRRANKNAVIYVADTTTIKSLDAAKSVQIQSVQEQTTQTQSAKTSASQHKRQVFSTFGKSSKKSTLAKAQPGNEALAFLGKNGLLAASSEVAASVSGSVDGRKIFAHEAAASHCHLSFGTYYVSTWPALNEAVCTSNYGGTWYPASTKPFINSTTVKNKTPTGFEVDVTASEAATVYAVLLLTSATAPTSAQVIAGTDGNGNGAIRAANVAASNTGTFSFTGLDSNANYILYVAARDASMEITPTPAQVNPAFESGLISNAGTWKFPKIRVSNTGDFYLGQSDSGVIKFRKWNGAGFSDYTTITNAALGAHGVGWGNEQRVDFEIDSAGGLHVVFSVYEGQMADTGDPYYGYFNGTSWAFAKIGESGGGVDNVDIFIDSSGKIHTSFMVANGVGNPFYYATNKSGSWAMTLIVNAAGGQDEIHDSYVVANPSGDATVIYRREDNQNNAQDNYYIATSTNAFASPAILLNGKVDLKQYRLAGLHIDADNYLHYAYANTSDNTSYYVTNASGSWVQTPISKGTHTTINVQDYERVGTTNYFASFGDNKYFMSSYDGSTWVDGFDFTLNGWMNDRFAISSVANRIMYVSENSGDWSIHYHSGVIAGYITPAAPNNLPTDISLSVASVNQSAGPNAVVGTLGTTDADSGNTHTYSLVAGAGDTDNASFSINNNSLVLNDPSSLAAGTYSVLIRTTDNAGGTFDKAFLITVVDDVVATVSSIALSGSPLAGDTSITFTVTFNEAVSNVTADDFTLTAVGNAAGTVASVTGSGTTYTVTVNAITGNGSLRLDLKANTDIVDVAGNGNNTNGYVAAYSSGATHTVAIPTVPAVPAIGIATAGDGQVSVAFSEPDNGGATITGYTVTSSPGGITATGNTSPIVVTGLTNGMVYTFTVTATNSVGTSLASGASNAVTPKGTQVITFANPGSQSFGTTPSLSATTNASLAVTFSSSTTGVCTVSNSGVLTFITPGSCTINADQAGNTVYGPAFTLSQTFTVNGVVPGVPVITNVVPGDSEATVSFTPPANNGGTTITGYTLTAQPGGLTATGNGSPITITGLTNGEAYTFTITATNSTGTGSPSTPSTPVTPAAVQTITFNDPGAQNFGTNPTLVATSNASLTPVFSSSTTGICTVTASGELTFVSTGVCTIVASQEGNTQYLPAQATRSFTVNPVVPGAPVINAVTPGDGQVSITFGIPAFTGGTAITGYTVTSSPGGITASNMGSPIVLTGLTNGQSYTFTITATNAVGTGAVSDPSLQTTPMATQTITFADPDTQLFGTSPTLAASSSSGLPLTFSSSTPTVCTVTSGGVLTFITTGSCTVSANQAGDMANAPATLVRTFTVSAVAPSTPLIGTVTAGDGQAIVSFTPPANVGGSPVTGYTVTAMPGGITASGTGSPITVTGLANGTNYTFTVTAMNAAGTSLDSESSESVKPMVTQTLTFADPGPQSFGSPLTLTASSSAGLAPVFSSSTPTVCTVTSAGAVSFLTVGTCTISAGQAGDAEHNPAATITRSFIINAVVPGAPVITSLAGGNAEVTVNFDASTTVGGSPVIAYTVTAMPGGITATGTSSPIKVTGLVNGTSYTFTVTATNAAGTSTASPASAAVIPGLQQTVSITSPEPGTQEVGVPLTLVATSSSGLVPVFSSSTPAVCTVSSDGQVTFVAAGACTLHIDQPGDSDYLAAPRVTYNLMVNASNLAPVVTAPADITINATALYTPISLRQLLSLVTNTSAADIQTAVAQLARDKTDGEGCCSPRPQGLVNGDRILLRPGRHEIVWTATNSAGLSGSDIQVVNVRPLVSFSKNQVTVKGNTAPVRIILNGPSPFYPLQVPYVIDASSTAAASDHNLTSGIATFTQGQTEVTLNAVFNSEGTPGNTQLVLALDDTSAPNTEPLTGYDPLTADIHDINAGATHRHIISIVEGNVVPKTTLVVSQNNQNTILVAADGGPVTITATVVDPNNGDTHSFDWSRTPASLVDTDGNATNNTFVIDPSGQLGLRHVSVITRDSAGATDIADIYFRIVQAPPVLEAGVDTDEDGIDDLTEGTADTNGNGIPDYLDNMPSNNVLPQVITNTRSYLIECDPGVRCGLGQFALVGGSGGVQIMDDEIGTSGGVTVDPAFKPVGGIFDFVIHDLPTAGQSVSLVIPQLAPIPANAVYRKFSNGQWVSFVENANNSLHSTSGNEGYCPPPGSDEWQPGLIEGHLCVQLTIEDGGPNDTDNEVNAAVVDPGAVSVQLDVEEPEPPQPPPPAPTPVQIKSTGGGGSVPAILLIALGALGVFKKSRAKNLVIVLALLVSSTQAAENRFYVRADLSSVSASQKEETFVSALAGAGYQFQIDRYDETRSGYQLSLGYEYGTQFFTELGYLDLGEVKVDLTLAGDTNLDGFTWHFDKNYPMSAEGVTLVQGLILTPNSTLKVSGEIGVYIWRRDVDVINDILIVSKNEGEDPLVGLRLELPLGDRVGLGLGIRRIYFDTQETDLISFSGSFYF